MTREMQIKTSVKSQIGKSFKGVVKWSHDIKYWIELEIARTFIDGRSINHCFLFGKQCGIIS